MSFPLAKKENSQTFDDIRWMRRALAYAHRGLGVTAPNPTVACLIVKNKLLLARGRTAEGGRPHAEAVALAEAGTQAQGATAYITLEPCVHEGRAEPCAPALIHAGVSRVVIAATDPDPRTHGKGISKLRKAGIEVETGVLEMDAREMNRGFFSVQEKKRPFVTLKMATTLDGKIATAKGESRWISSEPARNFTHILRHQNDAVMVGSGTLKIDNPKLYARLPGISFSDKIRITIDSHLSCATKSFFAMDAFRIRSILLTTHKGLKENKKKSEALLRCGVELVAVKHNAKGNIDLKKALEQLSQLGINSVLVEGGAGLATALLKEELIDELIWIHAPSILGADAIATVSNMKIHPLDHMPRFQKKEHFMRGEDHVTIFVPND